MSAQPANRSERNTSGDKINEFIGSQETFTDLLEELNTEKHTHELVTAVQGIGHQIIEEEQVRPIYLSPLEVGWLWLLWDQEKKDDKEFLSKFKE